MELEQIFQEADAALMKYAGVDVIVRRGEHSCRWRALIGSTVFEQTDNSSALIAFESVDFIGKAAALIFDDEAEPTEPQRGDRIWRTVRGTTMVYEVLNLNNTPCFKYSDTDRTSIRIHCKLIDEVAGI